MANRGNASSTAGQPKFTAPAAYEGGFTMLPNGVLRSTTLSGNAKALYAIMLDCAFTGAEPELPELGALLGGGKKTAMTAVRELTDAGLVTSKRRGQGLTNRYLVHTPDEAQKFPEGTSRSSSEAPPYALRPSQDADAETDVSTSGAGTSEPGAGKARPVFDAIARATGANPAASGGEIAKAEKAIRAAERENIDRHVQEALAAQPELDSIPKDRIDAWLTEKVRVKAEGYRTLRPEWELTPSALAKHWLRIGTWTPRTDAQRDEAEQAWQRVLNRGTLTDRDKRALRAIGGSFTVRSSTHLPTTRRDFLAAWDDAT